jgi:hypothetical protein
MAIEMAIERNLRFRPIRAELRDVMDKLLLLGVGAAPR